MKEISSEWIDSIVSEVLRRLSTLDSEMLSQKMLLMRSEIPEYFPWQADQKKAEQMLKAMIEGFEANACQIEIVTATDFLKEKRTLDGYRGLILEPLSYPSLKAMAELRAVTLAQTIAIDALRKGLRVISASPALCDNQTSEYFAKEQVVLQNRLDAIGLSLWQPWTNTGSEVTRLESKLITESDLKGLRTKGVTIESDAILTYSAKAYAAERGILIKRGR